MDDVKWQGKITRPASERPKDGSFETMEIDWKELRARSKTTELPVLIDLHDLSAQLEIEPQRLGFLHVSKNSVVKGKTIFKSNGKPRRLFYPNIYSGDEKISSTAALLKMAHKMLLYKLLQNLPRSDAAWGFVDGRDVLSCAAQHVDKDLVVAIDMTNFFPNTSYKKVRKALKEYTPWSDKVVWMVAELCTFRGHTPQGFSTSPMLSNFVFKPADDKILEWAQANGWTYTRYADDLILSANGDVLKLNEIVETELMPLIEQVAGELDYKINQRKTKIMFKPNRQHVLGMTVNKKLNLPRRDFYALKAEVHNFTERGLIPLSVYKEYHGGKGREALLTYYRGLRGRVAWGTRINPERLRRVDMKLDTVDMGRYRFDGVWEYRRRRNPLQGDPSIPEQVPYEVTEGVPEQAAV